MTETVPVQFQYSAQYSAYNEYSTDGTDGDFFQDHHTLWISYDSYDNKTGYTYTKILHGVDLQHTVHMSTSL